MEKNHAMVFLCLEGNGAIVAFLIGSMEKNGGQMCWANTGF